MYVDPKLFYAEIVKSKQEGELTKEAIKMICLIIQNYSVKFQYRNEMDRDDCQSHAIMQILRNWKTFDPDKSDQAFAYFTSSARTGLFMGWQKLYGYKKEGAHFSTDTLINF